MPKYRMVKKIPSCDVDEKLIAELENYIITKAGLICPDYLKIRENYKLVIYDSFGQEFFKSINDFKRTYFSNDIRLICLTLGLYSPKICLIEISFARILPLSEIEITCEDTTPRDTVNGVYSGVMDILSNYKNNNYLFHWHYGSNIGSVIAVLLAILFTVFSLQWILYNFSVGYKKPPILAVLFLSLIILYIINTAIFKPYTRFKTRLNESLSAWYRWFLLTFIAFCLSGTVFPIVVEYFRFLILRK